MTSEYFMRNGGGPQRPLMYLPMTTICGRSTGCLPMAAKTSCSLFTIGIRACMPDSSAASLLLLVDALEIVMVARPKEGREGGLGGEGRGLVEKATVLIAEAKRRYGGNEGLAWAKTRLIESKSTCS